MTQYEVGSLPRGCEKEADAGRMSAWPKPWMDRKKRKIPLE